MGGILTLLLTGCAAQVAQGTAEAPQAKVAVMPLRSSEGTYVSPIKADGSLATWVVDGMSNMDNAKESDAAKLFRYFFLPVMPNMLIDKKAREDLVVAFGGWDFIRSTSDLSFNSIVDFRHYLLSFKGRDVFSPAWAAASSLYPEVGACGQKPFC